MKSFSWPVAITAVCVLFFLGMVSFVVFSIFHGEELVAPDYYDQELRHQQRIDSDLRARALGVTNLLVHDASRAVIALALPGATGTAGSVTLYRPSAARMDRVVPLDLDEQGRQEISTRDLAQGRWSVRATWVAAGVSYFAEQEIVLP